LSGVTLDITERKNSEERHALLAREVDHRAKNALALVQSILRLTKAPTMQGYVSAVEGRISALAHAHTLLSESRWQGADIRKLVFDELAPFEKMRGDFMLIEGPSMTLQPEAAQSLALVVHELATNSAKYGSLSSRTGKLAVKWWNADGRLHIDWTEHDGPPVKMPENKGFGIRVISVTIENQMQGKVDFDWADSGLHCRIAVPYSAKRRSESWMRVREATLPQANSKGGRPILLVEDEMLVGMALKEALCEMGMETVGPFGGVREALAAACTNDISAAVLDVSLGDELVYEVADFLSGRKIPFVFVTGYGREGVDARFGDVPILCKPVDHGRLCKILEDYVSSSMATTSSSRAKIAG
jgi:two-component sensor histidine kinase/ActR/RegA family two-component response regulator